MQVAECPNCGTPIEDDNLSSEHQQLILASGSLVVAAAIVGLLLENPDYEVARPGFRSKIGDVIEHLRQAADELASWGEAFDAD